MRKLCYFGILDENDPRLDIQSTLDISSDPTTSLEAYGQNLDVMIVKLQLLEEILKYREDESKKLLLWKITKAKKRELYGF